MKKQSLIYASIILVFLPSIFLLHATVSFPSNTCEMNCYDTPSGLKMDSYGTLKNIECRNDEKQTILPPLQVLPQNTGAMSSPFPDGATLNVTPMITLVQLNNSFSINITVNPPQAISGVQCDILFDPSLLRTQSIKEGNLFSLLDTYFNPGIIDNTQGIITSIYGGSLLGNTSKFGTFAIINFTTTNKSGISLISFSNVVIGSPQGIPLSIIATPGIVTIQEANHPPAITITSPSNGSQQSGIVIVKGMAYDPDGSIHGVEVKIDQGPWINATGAHIWSYPWNTTRYTDGVHTLLARSFDGNTYSLPLQINITIDNTPPSTSYSLSGIGGLNTWFTSDVHVTLESHDETTTVSHIKYQINNESFQIYDTPFILTLEGIYSLTYYSQDSVNNTETYQTVTFGIDKTPPVTLPHFFPIIPSGDNGWYRHPVKIWFTFQDNISGGRYTWYQLDKEDYKQYRNTTGPLEITPEGIHTISYYTVDNAGNEENHHRTMIKIDASPPKVTLLKPKDNTLYLWDREIMPLSGHSIILGPLTVMIDAKDAMRGVARVTFIIDDTICFTDSSPPFHYPLNERSLLPQRHSLLVKVSDFAGNINETSTKTIWILKLSK